MKDLLWLIPLIPLLGAAVNGLIGNRRGWSLYRDYLLPFEVVSIVLLVAMIGAIVMGRKDKEERA